MEREYLPSENSYRAEKQLPHLRLLDWHEDNHQLVKCLIDSLKQGGPDFIFKRLGLEMFSRFLYFNLWSNKNSPVFVPAPPRSKFKEDHAFMLAKALSFYFGGEVKNLLERDSASRFQKKQSKRDRAFVKMKSKEFVSFRQPVVFVDDVLTTGSTARVAFQTLNKPPNFFIFTLTWRRLTKKEEAF